MKIMVKAKGDDGERDIAFSIHLPLSILKMNFIWNQIASKTQSTYFPVDIPGKEIYRVLKTYIKENGHLTIVDVDTKDAKVKIVI